MVILPALGPALLTGFALAFARGVGEYGSVIFIAGNMPMCREIAPLLIVIQLEQFDYAGAAALGVVMLLRRRSRILLLRSTCCSGGHLRGDDAATQAALSAPIAADRFAG